MTDEEATQLLRLLEKYLKTEADDSPQEMTISDLIDDLAMSMDVTTDEVDQIRRQLGN